jgi:hypothetical protein
MVSCVTGPPRALPQSASGSPTKSTAPKPKLFKPTPLNPIYSPADPIKDQRPALKIKTDTVAMAVSPEGTPPIPPPKSAPTDDRNSPVSRPTPTRKDSLSTLRMLANTLKGSDTPMTESPETKGADSKVSTPATGVSASPSYFSLHKRQQSDLANDSGRQQRRPSDLTASPKTPRRQQPDSSRTPDGGSTISEPSMVNRGRPCKRTQASSKPAREQSASSSPSSSSDPIEVWTLPTGIKKVDALRKFNESDRQKLQRQAASQAEKFEILNERDITKLSKVCFNFSKLSNCGC